MQKLTQPTKAYLRIDACTIENFIIYSVNINYLPCARQCARLLRYIIKQKLKGFRLLLSLVGHSRDRDK